MPVAEPDQPVVEVVLVRGREALTSGRPPEDREHHVEQGHPEDDEGQHQWGEEEPGLTGEGVVRLTTDGDRRRGHQQPQHERARVAHEDRGRVEVPRQEAEADADDDRRDERADVAGVEQADAFELDPVDEERGSGDADDARGQAIEAVDQVHGVGHHDDPEDRDHHREVGGEHGEADERDRDVHDRDAGEGQGGSGHDHPGQLGGRGDLTEIVDEPGGEDDRRGARHTQDVGGRVEDGGEAVQAHRDTEAGEQPEEHGDPAERGRRAGVDPPVAGWHHGADAPSDDPGERDGGAGHDGRGDEHDHVLAARPHRGEPTEGPIRGRSSRRRRSEESGDEGGAEPEPDDRGNQE